MFYTKNFPAWERIVRIAAGVAGLVFAAIVDLPELGGSTLLRDSGLKLFTLVDFAGH